MVFWGGDVQRHGDRAAPHHPGVHRLRPRHVRLPAAAPVPARVRREAAPHSAAVGVRGRHGSRVARRSRWPGLAEATTRAGPAIAAVLLNTAPFFVAVIARLVLAETVTTLRAIGLVVGFGGVVMIILAGGSSSGEDVALGAALALLGAIGYGCAGLLVRYLSLNDETFDVIGITAAQFLCGSVFLVPYLLLSGDVAGSDWSSPELWWSIAFIVIGAQVLAYLTFNVALDALVRLARLFLGLPRPGRRDPDRGPPGSPARSAADDRHGRRRARHRDRQPAGGGGISSATSTSPRRRRRRADRPPQGHNRSARRAPRAYARRASAPRQLGQAPDRRAAASGSGAPCRERDARSRRSAPRASVCGSPTAPAMSLTGPQGDAGRAQAIEPDLRALAEQHRRELVKARLAMLVAGRHRREARIADHPLEAELGAQQPEELVFGGTAIMIQPSRRGSSERARSRAGRVRHASARVAV